MCVLPTTLERLQSAMDRSGAPEGATGYHDMTVRVEVYSVERPSPQRATGMRVARAHASVVCRLQEGKR
jgi:hypothetical protein